MPRRTPWPSNPSIRQPEKSSRPSSPPLPRKSRTSWRGRTPHSSSGAPSPSPGGPRSCARRRESLRTRKDEYARTMTREMGKPIVQARGRGREVRRHLRLLRRARRGLPRRPAARDRRLAQLRPLRPARRRAGHHAVELPLLAGVPLRRAGAHGGQRGHPQARLQRAAAARSPSRRCSARAGFPEGLFRTAAGRLRRGRRALIADPRIVAVTLTGSERAGQRGGRSRRAASSKKTVLELGGSDPFIVLADADVDAAAHAAAEAPADQQRAELHRGQALHRGGAPSRDRFLERFASELASRRDGRPARARHAGRPAGARRPARRAAPPGRGVGQARAPARCSAAQVPTGTGAFYPPTLLAAVDRGMPAFDEETFGPVAAVIRAKDEADALRLANDSPFGLGAAIWTQDRARARAPGRADRGGRGLRERRGEVRLRASPSAASSAPATAASSPSTASASSSTSSRSGSRDRPSGRIYPVAITAAGAPTAPAARAALRPPTAYSAEVGNSRSSRRWKYTSPPTTAAPARRCPARNTHGVIASRTHCEIP